MHNIFLLMGVDALPMHYGISLKIKHNFMITL
jgi:hypothetical protein